MDFVLNEVIEEDNEFKLVFSDDSEEEFTEGKQELNFIDDDEGEVQEDAPFYRSVDNNDKNFQIRPEILTMLSTSRKMNTMVKIICLSCLIQKTGKMLNLIRLTIILTNLKSLKIASCVLQMWIISFFKLFSTVLCTVNSLDVVLNFNLPKEFWELDFLSN